MTSCKQNYLKIVDNVGSMLPTFESWKKHNFRCSNGDCYNRISVQYNKYSGIDAASCAIVVAAGFHSIHKFLKKLPGDFCAPLRREPVIMVTNIGKLFSPSSYATWEILPETDTSDLANEIVENITKYAFPFFERYSNVHTVLRDLEEDVNYNIGYNDIFCIAGIYYLKGDVESAIQRVKYRLEQYKAEYADSEIPIDLQRLQNLQLFLDYLTSKRAND